MFGWQAGDIVLLIPTSEWKKLSRGNQVDLTYFAESLTAEIRRNPTPYVKRWNSYYKRTEQLEGDGFDGLPESSYIGRAQQLCDSCWGIAIGELKRDGFHDESYPVSGKTVESFRQSSTLNN